MAGSKLKFTFGDLLEEVTYSVGWGLNVTDATKAARAKLAVKSGYRQFLFPPPVGDNPPHTWSFMIHGGELTESNLDADAPDTISRQLALITTTAGVDRYYLPDEFGGILGEPTYKPMGNIEDNQRRRGRITIVSDIKLRALAGNALQIGTGEIVRGAPQYASYRITRLSQQPTVQEGENSDTVAFGQRYLLTLYPVPNSTYELNFQYFVLPTLDLDFDSDDTVIEAVPLGGVQHAETLRESCLAAAEVMIDDEAGVHRTRFLELLSSSVAYDSRILTPTESDVWDARTPVDEFEQTLDQEWLDIAMQVGNRLGFGFTPSGWGEAQRGQVRAAMQSGYRQFNSAHPWKHLKPLQKIDINDTTNVYTLPDDYGTIVGELTYVAAAHAT